MRFPGVPHVSPPPSGRFAEVDMPDGPATQEDLYIRKVLADATRFDK